MNHFDTKQQSVKRHFKIAWIFFVSIFMGTIGFYQYQRIKLTTQNQLTLAVKNYANTLDAQFKRLLKTHKSLALESPCETILKSQLEALDFENPNISGIVVSDVTNKILCSTTDYEQQLPKPAPYSPSLLGPIPDAKGKKEIYLLQEQVNNFYYGIYLLGKVLTNKEKNPAIEAIALEESTTGKIIYQQKPFNFQSELVIRQPLSFLENLNLLALPKEELDSYLLFKTSLLPLALLILSIFLYFYLRQMILTRFSLKTALETALFHNKFKPYYLPTWNEAEKQYTGAEVLMRWHVDKEAIIYPEIFIIEAEKTGLIVPMTIQLIEETFKESHKFLKQHELFLLSFNITAAHFVHSDFFKTIYALIKKYAIRPEQIMFELTERALLNVLDEELKNRLHELIHAGFHLAVDDFGTGHASINYLRHFPFTHLKIDRIFIQSIGTGAITETLSYSIIQLGNTLQLKLIAEGVETKEQYDYLKKNTVNFMQGWYFSKAIRFDNLKELMKSKEAHDH